jgi:two-component system CheB/CheR fusion protein
LKASDLARRALLEQKRELQAARELLKEHLGAQEALREDYQSANEEMLSANEELQSTNEELETSKEELQATNEELNTVNDELNSNNATLHLLGNDLKNLLESTVMVDNGLCIRRMTPTAETVFKVLPSDIGRPITDKYCFRLRSDHGQFAPYCLLLRPESPWRRGSLDLAIETASN